MNAIFEGQLFHLGAKNTNRNGTRRDHPYANKLQTLACRNDGAMLPIWYSENMMTLSGEQFTYNL
jgi:hypothetical protein